MSFLFTAYRRTVFPCFNLMTTCSVSPKQKIDRFTVAEPIVELDELQQFICKLYIITVYRMLLNINDAWRCLLN